MLKIKLTRLGSTHRPFFRIVVAEARSKRDGKTCDILGFYDPKTSPPTIKIDQKKLEVWLARGAQLTSSVEKIIKS